MIKLNRTDGVNLLIDAIMFGEERFEGDLPYPTEIILNAIPGYDKLFCAVKMTKGDKTAEIIDYSYGINYIYRNATETLHGKAHEIWEQDVNDLLHFIDVCINKAVQEVDKNEQD